MARRSLGFSLCMSILSLYFSSGCAAKGKRILDIPEGFVGIVAYGSLFSYVLIKEFSDSVTGSCEFLVLSYKDIVWEETGQILFVSKRDGNAELCLMNADGSGV